MLGVRDRRQPELFVAGSLRELLPEDHVLVRVDRVLDPGWLHDEVKDLYSADLGRPGIDAEVAVRLMLGIVHDRRLMREAQVNLAIRWFIGYGLHEALSDHSSPTRIRQRWGTDRFEQIFARSVAACVDAGIAKGEVVYIDSSLIRAGGATRCDRRTRGDGYSGSEHGRRLRHHPGVRRSGAHFSQPP